jgi:hypothetical protein
MSFDEQPASGVLFGFANNLRRTTDDGFIWPPKTDDALVLANDQRRLKRTTNDD